MKPSFVKSCHDVQHWKKIAVVIQSLTLQEICSWPRKRQYDMVIFSENFYGSKKSLDWNGLNFIDNWQYPKLCSPSWSGDLKSRQKTALTMNRKTTFVVLFSLVTKTTLCNGEGFVQRCIWTDPGTVLEPSSAEIIPDFPEAFSEFKWYHEKFRIKDLSSWITCR